MATRNADTDPTEGLPQVVVDDLLAVDSRRCALELLREEGDAMVVEDLAEAVVANRDGCDCSAVSESQRSAMANELFSAHIPKLTATGVVRYDSMLGAVELERPDILPD